VNLRQVQGLSFQIIGERFGISATRVVQIFKRQQKKQQASNVKPENLHVTNIKAFTSRKLQTS
jgi:DNA-directed RNA polymerase specialized sigma24 family protein